MSAPAQAACVRCGGRLEHDEARGYRCTSVTCVFNEWRKGLYVGGNRAAHDMPKMHSPFVRRVVEGAYVVTPEVAPGYAWVFEDPAVIATEKLHGTNVSIVKAKGEITEVYNREARIPFFSKGKRMIQEGLLESFDRGYMDGLGDGQHFGELIGPKLHGDPHQVGKHVWLPFATYVRKKLAYKSWGKYPKTYEALSSWFETGLGSLLGARLKGHAPTPEDFCEGIVFVRPSTGEMAKLRRDMFPWFKGPRHNEDEGAPS